MANEFYLNYIYQKYLLNLHHIHLEEMSIACNANVAYFEHLLTFLY